MLIFQLAVILLASKIAGEVSSKLGQPSVLGKLLIGIILGPSVLGLISNTEILKEISQIGVILLMFIAGLETDIDEFKRSGKSSMNVGVVGIVVPLALGYAAGMAMGLPTLESVFLGLLLSATSVSISVQALKELGKLKSKEGATILGAAVIDDVLVIIALAFVMSFAGGDVNLGMVVLKKVAFFAVVILLSWKVVPWVLRKFAPLKVTEAVVTAALIICFLFAYLAEYTGVAAIIGAYIAGIAISLTNYRHEVTEKVETISYSIFVPVFFTSIGVSAQFNGIVDHLWLIVGLSILAVLTKFIGGALGAKVSGFGWRSSWGIGSAMVSRGEVALIIASIGLEAGLLADSMFAVLIVVVLVTTIVTPPMMKIFFSEKETGKEQIALRKEA
ncbi:MULTISPECIES: cation:proton antiporter [Brevibacillus]|jgi:monovalent cation:proton antiporter-2 (CPA2) family protein|uniref:Na(+)/H(+)-K(+) antiporter n=2 Tax=Brevibacillus borstelensis TaxID=45462 RepID=M8DWN3_9BACL|nr:cation:proton antiporter [Brevibacillus borstelensis]EMT51426.1 Na(+)/H(+)-K(+) antiporter [Brevibacillus borstelensis AK1]KKX54948.1 sodium:proton antiporter [Brevibacillus borstelensis cifa_chp40]MBE5396293.1 cation:proton antiporter [Brevibacillus borstelensis]MCC0564404.1 cation:proton antiporter [Brevibacillus borstelensis]MCM3473137.1 cation:proton antiporter [Brevibacillus borstelensis]